MTKKCCVQQNHVYSWEDFPPPLRDRLDQQASALRTELMGLAYNSPIRSQGRRRWSGERRTTFLTAHAIGRTTFCISAAACFPVILFNRIIKCAAFCRCSFQYSSCFVSSVGLSKVWKLAVTRQSEAIIMTPVWVNSLSFKGFFVLFERNHWYEESIRAQQEKVLISSAYFSKYSTFIFLWMPLALFVISLVFSALISISYLVKIMSVNFS